MLLSILSITSKLLGFVREQVIAWRFGASASVDSYVAALMVPQLFAGLIGGAVAAGFLPVYSSLKGSREGRRLAGTIVAAISLAAMALAVVTIAFAPHMMRVLVGSFSAEQQAFTTALVRIMSAGVLFLSLTAFLSMLFNGHGQFFAPGFAPLLQNLTIVGGLVLYGSLSVRGLATFTALGFVMPTVLLLILGFRNGLPLLHRPIFTDPAFIKVLKLSGPILASGLFGQLYVIIDRRLASGLDAGSIASLSYGFKLVQLPVGIFVAALATAVYPTLADYASKKDMGGFGRTVSSSLRTLAMLLIPASVGMYVLRYPIVRLAFERGSFDSAATLQTGVALGFYTLGLMGVAGGNILTRGFYSLQDSMTPVKVGMATAVVNVILAVFLVRPLGHGGLALANSIGMLFNAGVLLYLLRRHVEPGSLDFGPLMAKVLAASVVMGAVSAGVHGLLSSYGQLVSLGGAVGAGLAVYAALLLVLRVEELELVRRRFWGMTAT
jgi:putative peptidoglycan lipid II flippase